MTTQKLKPIAGGIISLLSGSETVASWRVPLLQPLHVENGAVLAAGALLDSDSKSVGFLNIGGIPLSDWPSTKPVGRPKSDEKHLAVFLAWCLYVHRRGGKRGLADEDAATQFGYSGAEKIRTIRASIAKRFGVSLNDDVDHPFFIDMHNTSQAGTRDAVVLIERPTIYRQGVGAEILGNGFAWHDECGERVMSGAIRCEIETIEDGFDLEGWINKRGPVILTSIRPALK